MNEPSWMWDGEKWVPLAPAAAGTALAPQPAAGAWPPPWDRVAPAPGPFGQPVIAPRPESVWTSPPARTDSVRRAVAFADEHKAFVIMPIVFISIVLSFMAAGRIATGSAAATSGSGSGGGPAVAVAPGDQTITITLIRGTTTRSLVLTAPADVITRERDRIVRVQASGALPATESLVVEDGDQPDGTYVCSMDQNGEHIDLYGTGLSSSTCSDLTAVANDLTG